MRQDIENEKPTKGVQTTTRVEAKQISTEHVSNRVPQKGVILMTSQTSLKSLLSLQTFDPGLGTAMDRTFYRPSISHTSITWLMRKLTILENMFKARLYTWNTTNKSVELPTFASKMICDGNVRWMFKLITIVHYWSLSMQLSIKLDQQWRDQTVSKCL